MENMRKGEQEAIWDLAVGEALEVEEETEGRFHTLLEVESFQQGDDLMPVHWEFYCGNEDPATIESTFFNNLKWILVASLHVLREVLLMI